MVETSRQTSTRCMFVSKADDGETITREIRDLALRPLAQDHVRIAVEYSSLNYKDALCATGHPGVAKSLPIVPGIDAAGAVVESQCQPFRPGDKVMVFHARFGTESYGGYCEYIDVPGDWVYPIPAPLSAREVMIIGTAGFTAAQCVDELQKHGIQPDSGEVVVTGATGGVGIFAVKLLAQLGYQVVAVTGKQERGDWLKSLGAKSVADRQQVDDRSQRPLLQGRWAGAVDTVGGNILATILRSTRPHGCVTACGLVGGVDLNISVYPFILRGITLQGIDTAGISRDYRRSLWQRLAVEWSFTGLQEIAEETDLDGLDDKIGLILGGQVAGRVLVRIGQ